MIQRNIILFATLLFVAGCQDSKFKTAEKHNAYSFYLGTYTDGESEGVYKLTMDTAGHIEMIGLVATTNNPSFLAFANHQQTLLAVNEIRLDNNMGTVESYQINDSLKLISRKASGGAHPCFVTANNSGEVLTANYSGGNIGYLLVEKNGELSDLLEVQQHEGSGSLVNRQDRPHAHSVWFQPNSNNIIAVDLGTNELWISSIDMASNKFIPAQQAKVSLADGAGPRHLAFHPNGNYFYVINELDNTITTFSISSSKEIKLVANVSTLPANFEGVSNTADLHISNDGKFLYGSNRGHNSIVIYEVQKDGALKLVGHQPTGGDHPRNFSLSPDDKFLLVANKNTNNIVCFERNSSTGLLTFVDEVKAPSPVCILFEK